MSMASSSVALHLDGLAEAVDEDVTLLVAGQSFAT